MAGKKRPSAAPQPQDDSVYRVKHITRSAWEEGALSLPGLASNGMREEEPEFDDVAMDMAMTGEIPLELIRDMLRAQERQQGEKKNRKREPVGGMILPEEIVPAKTETAAKAEMAAELPTPEEIAAAKAELRAMKSRSRLPQEKEKELKDAPQKGKGSKKERIKKVRDKGQAGPLGSIQLAETAGPTEESKEAQPAPAEEAREKPHGQPSLARTFGLLSYMRQGEPGFWEDDAPLYHVPLDDLSRALFRSLYYFGLRFARPLRIAAGYALPHLMSPLLVLWHLARAAAITLHHLTVGRARRAFQAAREVHARRVAERTGAVGFKTSVLGLLADYLPVLRPAVNTAMPLAALAVLLIVIQGVSSATYALKIVNYHGNDLGYIKDESVYLQAQAAANRHIAPLPEAALEEGEPAASAIETEKDYYPTFELARVQPEQLTNVYTLTDQLLDNASQEMTSACGIYIDGKLFATIKNSTDADSVLTSIKNMKSAHLKLGENAAVGFVQRVDTVQGSYPTAQLVDAQTLLKMLTQPQREEATIALREGDTISGLQSRYGVSLGELYALNPDLQGNETKLRVGDELTVRAEVSTLEVKIVQTETRTEEVPYQTEDSDNYNYYRGEVRIRVKGVPGQDRVTERVTYINGVRVGEPEEINRSRIKEPVTERRDIGRKSTTVTRNDGTSYTVNVNAMGFQWPVPDCSRISSPYGYRGRSFHKGIDIADGNTNGKVIVAAKGGTVELVQRGGSSYGNQIVINHGNGVKTRYAHIMSGSISVSQGESVDTGQPIARVGSTGNSTGPHLHFEVIINGSTQNPLNYVKR